METTDRPAVRAIVAARRIDAAKVVEVQVVGVAIVRRSRPIVAVVADIVETATEVVATTRSRVPDCGSTTEHTGEVYASIGAVI